MREGESREYLRKKEREEGVEDMAVASHLEGEVHEGPPGDVEVFEILERGEQHHVHNVPRDAVTEGESGEDESGEGESGEDGSGEDESGV